MFKLQFKDNPQRGLWLVGDKISLGRAESNDLVLDGLGIEDSHAEIYIHPDYLILKSQPGLCVVNNLPVDAEYQLASGDELKIGTQRLEIIDPKLHPEALQRLQPAPAEAAKPVAASWSIVPDHPKLQQRDFSIVGRCVLGRASECEFSVPYKLLSRQHAALTVEGNSLILEDLGASNGCFVNGKRVHKATLQDGDSIAFAKLVFRVRAPEGLPAAGAGGEVNKTILRPAVDIQAALARAKRDTGRQGVVTVEFEHREEDAAGSEQPAPGAHKARWLVVAVVVVLAVAGWWWSPLNGST